MLAEYGCLQSERQSKPYPILENHGGSWHEWNAPSTDIRENKRPTGFQMVRYRSPSWPAGK